MLTLELGVPVRVGFLFLLFSFFYFFLDFFVREIGCRKEQGCHRVVAGGLGGGL